MSIEKEKIKKARKKLKELNMIDMSENISLSSKCTNLGRGTNDPRLVTRAAEFAKQKHEDVKQLRKYTDEPYFVHCLAVAERVAKKTKNPRLISAAFLHDTIEDTKTTYEELVEAFGKIVADLVLELTDVFTHEEFPYLNRKVRKQCENIRLGSTSPAAKMIKICDMEDNSKTIVANGKGFTKVFLAEKTALMPFLKSAEGNFQFSQEELEGGV